ncbi:hypothetical protein [Nocardioides sp. KR10-350]|uniref:hypothetical protein n=1 Tax=Nocardioides cheoyonin TaxID=3156615 RepID=UPI0032B4FD28
MASQPACAQLVTEAVAITSTVSRWTVLPASAATDLDTHVDGVRTVLDVCAPGPITLCGHDLPITHAVYNDAPDDLLAILTNS